MKPLRLVVPLAVTALLVSACGGKSSPSSSPGGARPSGAATSGGGFGQGRQLPGASGLVAALSGDTMQVQSTTAQTQVTFTPTTRFTATSTSSFDAVKVGVCATALPAFGGAAPSRASTPVTALTAATVVISPPTDGRCGGAVAGFGGGRGAFPSGAARPSFGGARPSGARGGRRFGGGGFGGFGASGLVASVSGTTFTVTEERGARGASSAPVTVTVSTDASTTFSATAAATAKALADGVCVTALGSADSTGAITATSIAVRPAVNGVCTAAGFGGGAFGGGQGPGGAGGPGVVTGGGNA